MSFKTFKFKKIINSNGSLIPIDLKRFTKFKIKRFFILNGKKNYIRGNHAHKKCTQIFIPITGRVELEIFNKKIKKRVILSTKNKQGVYVKPLNWCKIRFLHNNSSIVVIINNYDI